MAVPSSAPSVVPTRQEIALSAVPELSSALSDTVHAAFLGPEDPPPVTVLNPQATAPLLFVADHAANRVPASLDNLGLGPKALGRHIAYDIGVMEMTVRLAERFAATAVIHNYSRLILDPNRELDDPTSICAISDGIVVPANRRLTPADRAARAATFFHPYQDRVAAELDRLTGVHGTPPPLVAVHSFTQALHNGPPRPWQVGILWTRDDRLSRPLIEALAADGDLTVGDNEPYDARNAHGYTVERHADPRGCPAALIEVRQDLIGTPETAAAWGDRLADALTVALARLAAATG